MNTEKVRIYDLSKELNLENKDILAVCEDLNIVVKNHSSTVTESQAGQIRSAAERNNPSRTATAGRPVPKVPERRQIQKKKPPVKKQQILEIRRHSELKNLQAPQPPVRNEREATDPPLKASNKPFQAHTKLTPPNSPTHPTSTLRPSQSTSVPEPQVTEAVTARSEHEGSASPATLFKPPIRPDAKEGQLTLVKPTHTPKASQTRAAKSPSQESISGPEIAEHPRQLRPTVVIKQVAQDTQAAKSPSQESVSGPGVAEHPRQLRSTVVIKQVAQDKGSAVTPSQPTDSPDIKIKQSVQELRRPKKLVRPTVSAPAVSRENSKPEPTPLTTDGREKEAERRSIPSSRGKRMKRYEEVEEAGASKKASKSKGKRLNQFEEDEEFESELQEADGDSSKPAQVTLSLIRPPKPASHTKGTTSTTTNYRQHRKPKTAPKTGRRDRQQQVAQVERPEILVLAREMTIQELAQALVMADTEIVKLLFFKGIAATVTQTLDIATVKLIAEELGVLVETPERESEAKKITEMLDEGDLEHLQRRPPVITIMGHVDHGKTTLLDAIRKTKVAQGEAGGITQHIGAYHVNIGDEVNPQQIVFLDTPGHEAFTAMRARGTRVTDIAILVVAADDGVRPQTIEAISHAKAAGVPIVVAINKIDKESAQPDRVKQELTEHGLVPEEWGGETIMVPVSAISGENLDTLLEMLLLVSEIEELSANPERLARGTVIEANLDKARGPVATLLVQNGTLRVGDVLVVGSVFAKVRAMVDDRGQRVGIALPSFAVEVLGLSDVPTAGDEFEVFSKEKDARAIAEQRLTEQRQSRLRSLSSGRVSLGSLSAEAQEGKLKQLNLIVKADVQGSLEAIVASLNQLPQEEVQIRVLLSAPGEITENDVDLAAASQAVIVGFNTTFASGAKLAAENAGVDVREYDIIYKLLEDIQGAMEGLLEPELVEDPLGQVEVRAVFPVGRGAVAGCYVLSGKILRNAKLRVHRDNQVIYEGNLDSLRRMRDDVKEVNAGYECGIGLDSFRDWQEEDIIEVFRMVSKRRSLTTT